MNEKVIIFCDGASKGNPGPGGWGAIVAVGKQVHELGGHEAHTTNNRMELTAALKALELASTLVGNVSIVVYTDSSYVINGITKWVRGWKYSGWITKDKKEVMNQDLWKPLDEVVEEFANNIEWQYVGGHVGIAGNERVDEIASELSLGKKIDFYTGPSDGYFVDIKNVSFDEAKQKTKSDSKSRSKLKAYSYVSAIGGEVVVHKTWDECAKRVRGKAAKFKKSLSPEDEVKIIKEFSQ